MLFNTITSYDMQVQKQETKGHVQVKYIKQIKISIVNAKHNVNCKSSNTFTFQIQFFLVTVVVPYTSINKIKS